MRIALRRIFPVGPGIVFLLAIAWPGIFSPLHAREGFGRDFFSWTSLPPFPDAMAVGSAAIGEHGGVLLVAGGERKDGVRSDRVFAMAWNGSTTPRWKGPFQMPKGLAEAGAVATEHGVVIAGGFDRDGPSGSVFLLRWDPVASELEVRTLPGLPMAGKRPALIWMNPWVLALGQGNAIHRIHLDEAVNSGQSTGWIEAGRLPGPERMGAVGQTLSDGERNRVYFFGGTTPDGDEPREGFRSGDPSRFPLSWEPVAGSPPLCSPGTGAVRWGLAHLLTTGPGSNGVFRLLSHHSISNTWADRGEFSENFPPAAISRHLDGLVVLFADGQAVFGVPHATSRWFGPLDYAALGLYLAGLVGLGAWCSRRNRGTGDYFLAGRRIPAWAAALSLMATSVSSIGFIAIPGKTFATDWLYFSGIVTWFVVVPVVTMFLIPALRNLNVTTAYEYLEDRFNLPVRLFASLLFILMQIGRLAIVLYLPALVLSSVMGLDIYLCIAVMGVVSILYTVLGGMEAVVWTDVAQVIVLFGGALLGIGIALAGTGMGAAELWQTAWGDGKLRVADWRWDHTAAVFWVVIVGNIFSRFSNLSSDQAIVQRYLTTPDTRSAVRALWGDVAVSIPWAFVAFAFGTALYLFYKANPEFLLPGTEADSVVPVFIAQQMPTGVAGLIIASIFAAAMSSLDSTIHSLSTVCVRDFYGRLVKTATEARQFFVARALTVFFGLLGTGAAMAIATFDVKSLWDLFIMIMGLFVGSLSGLFVLGLFFKPCHGRGALVGAVCSAVIVYLVSRQTSLHFFLYPAVGVTTCVTAGWLASLILPSTVDSSGGKHFR